MMIRTKKLLCILLAALLIFSLAACGDQDKSGSGKDPAFTGELTDYLTQLVDGVDDPEMATETSEVPEDLFSWIFFIDPVEGAEAAVHQPMNGSIPYCIALLRLPEGAENGDAIRDEIEEKADPRKWVCVEAEKTAVIRRGNLILLAMADSTVVDAVTANFMALS